MDSTKLLPALIRVTAATLELKQRQREFVSRRAAVHALHIKQVNIVQRDLVSAISPIIKAQVEEIARKAAVGNKVRLDVKEQHKKITNATLPILAVRMAEAARNQLLQLGVKRRRFKSFEKQNAISTVTTKASTATDWLESQDDLDTLLDESGLWAPGSIPFRIATELPGPLKEKIVERLRESFGQDYWDNISKTTQGDAERILERGLQEGSSIADMAKELRERLGGDEYARTRAFNIARTESGNALNGGRKSVFDQLQEGLGDKVDVKPEWLSVLSNTTRSDHAALDGVPADEDGLWELGGMMIPWPGYFALEPGERCNCMCSLTVVAGMDDSESRQIIDDYYSSLQDEENGNE